MPSVQHSPSLCRLVRWRASLLSRGRFLHESKLAGPGKGKASTRPSPNPATLLEELFPDEAKAVSNPTTTPDRHIPRLVLGELGQQSSDRKPRIRYRVLGRRQARRRPDQTTAGVIEQYVSAGRSGALESTARRATSSQHVSGQEPTVLALQHASPSLAESDFRRIIPGGKHIKGWKDEAKLLKVITGRDPQTLTPLGFYYLLFASPSSAKAYRDRVMYLHRIARTYTPQSLESPLPPPPGYMIDGEDAHALLHSYNLVPPSQNLVLRLLTPPFPRHLQQLIHHGGYSRVKMRNCGADHTVLLYVTGAQLRTWSIQRMIEEDGRNNRNALWRLAGGTHGITEMNSPVFNEPEAEEGEEDDMAYPTSVRGQSRWLLEFEDRAEALRFVRAWHKRPFPLRRDSTAAATMADDDGPNDDDDAPTVHAELIW